jgi:hypothetical protein
MFYIEIDQQTNFLTAQTQIREQLSLVDRQDALDRLEFNEYASFNDQVRPISDI